MNIDCGATLGAACDPGRWSGRDFGLELELRHDLHGRIFDFNCNLRRLSKHYIDDILKVLFLQTLLSVSEVTLEFRFEFFLERSQVPAVGALNLEQLPELTILIFTCQF